jgi:hypothetical protein
MIGFRNDSDKYGDVIEITFYIELWNFKEFIWKIINRISLRLGKGYYFIDCGYCTRRNGKMVCLSSARLSDDKDCYPEECLNA